MTTTPGDTSQKDVSDKRQQLIHDELPKEHEDPLISALHRIIRFGVKILAVLMVFVILWGIIDVVYVLYQQLSSPPILLLEVGDIFRLFGAFMVVLIAIEIFINIRLYLGTDVLPIQLVIATALMAIARKVIVMDFDAVTPQYVLATAAVVLALGVTHWLVSRKY
ncbi:MULTISPECIES: phosphate-starvation-inducible PsiE family protein [Halomonas]|uniref:phosphate-starvation-inducible PsiE family protein n=1 Tax=Halomonas TaxID=2745 RepID=UPI001C96C972|nr:MULTISPECIES: phosphate-starvation-inducible PsiE family protein [Halomonas]MBY5931285.1 phosphate-starvation-inducible PsiE family protein [Halomonas sp. DP8Y7-3]MBY5969182.1 phosphate-starvation-inducible PsiE family protein [Halomonas denitrificans]MED5296360.1 phosphate-starvation-inducible PsiE family protein [Pseudomonadota bacterium]